MDPLLLLRFCFKSAAGALAILFALQLAEVTMTGRTVRRAKSDPAKNLYPLVKLHESAVRKTFVLIAILIAVIEVVKRVLPGPPPSEFFLSVRWFHLWFLVAPFSILFLCTKFFLTGVEFPKVHRWFAYGTCCFGFSMTLSGIILLFLH